MAYSRSVAAANRKEELRLSRVRERDLLLAPAIARMTRLIRGHCLVPGMEGLYIDTFTAAYRSATVPKDLIEILSSIHTVLDLDSVAASKSKCRGVKE